MSKPDKCLTCGKGTYNHGSALYDYYSCGHAFEKPLYKEKEGSWVYFPSPYPTARHTPTQQGDSEGGKRE